MLIRHCLAQPDPLLSPGSPAEAVHTEARGAAKWPLTFTVILFIRVTGPFLSRCVVDQAYETLGASK